MLQIDLKIHVSITLHTIFVLIFDCLPLVISLIIESRNKDLFFKELVINTMKWSFCDFNIEFFHLKKICFRNKIDLYLFFIDLDWFWLGFFLFLDNWRSRNRRPTAHVKWLFVIDGFILFFLWWLRFLCSQRVSAQSWTKHRLIQHFHLFFFPILIFFLDLLQFLFQIRLHNFRFFHRRV